MNAKRKKNKFISQSREEQVVHILYEQDLYKWCKTYNLEIKEGICPVCNNKVKTTLPFRTVHYAGLMTPKCSCGHDLAAWTSKAISQTKKDFLIKLFKEFSEVSN